VTSIVNKNASAATLSYYNYGYDNADRVTSHTWQSGATPGSATYSYDATNQLTSDGATAYTYDLNGNRTMSGYQTGSDNRLTTDGLWTYTYDAEGNEIQKSKGSGLETWYYGYDTWNRLTSVRQTSDGSTNLLLVTYTYDVFGDRVQEAKWKQSTGTVTTRFHYDGQDVWADTDGSNALKARYLRGDAVDQVFARTEASGQANPGVAWYLTDRLGSVRDLMDATQALRDHLDYDGYGNATESNSGFGDRYKFTGREFDTDTGLGYYRQRAYDAKQGKFASHDPIGFSAGDANLYRYVGNQPTNGVDPSGTAWYTSKPSWYSSYAPRNWDEWVGRYSGLEWIVEQLARASLGSNGEYQGVGQPGLAESFIPVWGSMRAAFDDFQHAAWDKEHWYLYFTGSFNVVMAVLDVVMVGEMIKGGYAVFRNARKLYSFAVRYGRLRWNGGFHMAYEIENIAYHGHKALKYPELGRRGGANLDYYSRNVSQRHA
jgi:RHS repeat-associated protein